ncbi:MAG: hypothetical protein ACPG4X_14740 [Pikeienuella sp.]
MAEKFSHEQIIERVDNVQAELTEFKDDSKKQNEETMKRLRSIEAALAGLKGGWKVLMVLGSVLAGTLAAIASIVAVLKGLK